MEVTFIDHQNGKRLGKRTYDGISHTIIPAFKASGHDIFITKNFSKEPNYRTWLIKSIEYSKTGVEIQLEGLSSPESVVAYADKQRQNFKMFIRKHNIVEVDFGHESSLFSLNEGPQKNTLFTHSLMPGEMHKKRPCIVMGTRADSITVIPLTTKNYQNPKHIPLSAASFHNLHARYSETPSFAALDMIQTVSAHRVYPPREAEGGKYRHQYSRYKLSESDSKAIDTALADIYNDDVTKQLNIVKTTLEGVTREKTRILEKYRELSLELREVQERKTQLEQVISHVAHSLGVDGDFEQVLEQLKSI